MMKNLATIYQLLTTKAIKWVKENRVEALLLASVLLVGAFMRLYRIDEYMNFLGDEGRDVIVVRRLLINFDPILVGPGTSIGDMYLGPIYYYMMAPFLLLANFSPVGPAVMIALLGIASIFFVWWVAREWFGVLAAFISSSLYAISPVVIIYSRSSWNPNIMPFFSLLTVYSVWRFWARQEFKWLAISGIAFAFVLQSHYLGLLLAPIVGLFWLLTVLKVRGKRQELKDFTKYTVVGFGIFITLMSPLVIFDAHHGWRNFASMKRFFLERQTTVSARPWTAIPKLPAIVTESLTRIVAAYSENVGKVLSIYFLAGFLWISSMIYIILKKQRELNKQQKAFVLLLVWLFVAFLGLGVYKQEIYDHYYGFFFAAPFLLIGGIMQNIVQSASNKVFFFKFPVYFLLLGTFIFLVAVNLAENPLKYPPNRQLQRTIEVAEKIVQESGNQRFNLAVIAERNYEGAYQYFLESWNAAVVIIDPQRSEETITEQLFVVCEMPREKCDPTHSPKAGIANFGWSKLEQEWEVGGTILYKLIHTGKL